MPTEKREPFTHAMSQPASIVRFDRVERAVDAAFETYSALQLSAPERVMASGSAFVTNALRVVETDPANLAAIQRDLHRFAVLLSAMAESPNVEAMRAVSQEESDRVEFALRPAPIVS